MGVFLCEKSMTNLCAEIIFSKISFQDIFVQSSNFLLNNVYCQERKKYTSKMKWNEKLTMNIVLLTGKSFSIIAYELCQHITKVVR